MIELARALRVPVVDRTWRDDDGTFDVPWPASSYYEEYRVAMGVPTFACRSAEEKALVEKFIEALPKGT
jgi:hypothetical protein